MAKWHLVVSFIFTFLSATSTYADPLPRVNDESNFNDPTVGLWFGSSIAMCSRDTTDLKQKLQHLASAANDENRFIPERVAASATSYRLAKLKCLQSAIRAHFSQVNGPAPNDAKLSQLKKNPEMKEIIKRMEFFGETMQKPLPYKCDKAEDLVACKRTHHLRAQNDAGLGWALSKISASLSKNMEKHGQLSIQSLFDENARVLEKEAIVLDEKATALELALVRPKPRPAEIEERVKSIR